MLYEMCEGKLLSYRRMCDRCQDVHTKGLKACDCKCHDAGGYSRWEWH